MTDKQKQVCAARWKARTDLIWLCNHVLGFTKVSEELNGVMVSRMQKFLRPKDEEQMYQHDYWDKNKGAWVYRPLKWDETRTGYLPHPSHFSGRKRRLLLDSRSFYKSSINVIGHTIQWILNYPDIAIMIFQGSVDMASKFLIEIRDHFRYNEKLRALFPELCPDKPDTWGNMEEFTVPARTRGYVRREPTVKAMSIEKAGAGSHVEVIKYSDIVNEDNSDSKERCEAIADKFWKSPNLLMASATYWMDVEGTRYNINDVYGQIISEEIERQKINGVYVPNPEKREWDMYINICYKVANPEPSFDYDDMLSTDVLLQTTANVPMTLSQIEKIPDVFPVSRHPDHPAEKLEDERRHKPFIFNCQKLNNPVGTADEIPFPVNKYYPKMIKRQTLRERIMPAYYEIAVDTARTVARKSDFTAISCVMWDQGGRCYVLEIDHGKFHEETTAEKIIYYWNKYRPTRILMEKDNSNSGIRVWLQRKQEQGDFYLPIVDVPRTLGDGKKVKIKSVLRPWYINGDLRFVDDLVAYEALKRELQGFPQVNDDILDSLTMLFHDKAVLGRNSERPPVESEAFQEHIRHKYERERMKRIINSHMEKPQSSTSVSETGWL